MNKGIKILISAYACSPYRGSEPGVGWGFISSLAKCNEVWIIAEYNEFKKDIDNFFIDNPMLKQKMHFHYIKRTRNHLLEKIWPASYYWSYNQWQKKAFKLANELHKKIKFDVIHQLTMLGFREPGYLWKLNTPFVWGPIGGMGVFPWRLIPSLGLYGSVYYTLYNIINLLHMKFLSRPRLAAKSTPKSLLTATRENKLDAKKYWGCDSIILSEIGIPHNPLQEINLRSENEPLRIVWSGMHIPRKALNIGIKALSLLPSNIDWELHILGEGNETAKWKRLAKEYMISYRCHFYGWVQREEALNIMKKAHVMLITSLRDLTSSVTIEALTLGLPVICFDHFGFSDAVNSRCGIKIKVTNPIKINKDIINAITYIYKNENVRRKLAKGALNQSKSFSWDKKVNTINKVYDIAIKEYHDNRNNCR